MKTIRIFLKGGGSFDLSHVEEWSFSKREEDGTLIGFSVKQSGGYLRALNVPCTNEMMIGPVVAVLEVLAR